MFWMAVPERHLDVALTRVPRLGYTEAVDIAVPAGGARRRRHRGGDTVRWRRREYRLEQVYAESKDELRERAPDRRTFVLEGPDGTTHPVRGYRGGPGPMARRALPVSDARLLVNLIADSGSRFLDPFAGAGGIVLEALAIGCRASSCDIDRSLRAGLGTMGADHHVADARSLPFADDTFDAIATEPPYEMREDELLAATREMMRVLRTGGRLSILAAAYQAAPLRALARHSSSATGLLHSPVDRKGLAVEVLSWSKGRESTTLM